MGAVGSTAFERELAQLVRTLVREELAALRGDADPLVPHTEWPFGSRRHCAELARSGAIDGAVRRGKVWLARRSAVDAYAAAGERPTIAKTDDVGASIVSRAVTKAKGRH